MNTSHSIISVKKFFSFLILVAFVFPILPRSANAQLAVIDVANLSVNESASTLLAGIADTNATIASESASIDASAAANASSNAASETSILSNYSWDSYGKPMLDAAAYQMAQKLLTKLTNNTLSWIQGGFHGSPNFSIDTKELALQFADSIAGQLVLSLRNIAVCDFTINYKDDLIKAVEMEPKTAPYTFNKQATCPFNQNYTYKASDFYADFSKGGWAMMDAALSDGGNPYSVQMLTAREQAARLNSAKAVNDQKLSWSSGYTDIIDTTNCNYPATVFLQAGTDDPYHPGTILTEATAKARNDEMFSDPARVKALQKEYCKTTTPGKVVGDQLTKTLGVNMDRIGFADNMNKIVAAFINVAMESAIRGVFGTGNKTISTGSLSGSSSNPGGRAVTTIDISTLAPTDISQTAATLNGSLLFTGNGLEVVRVWFVVTDTSDSSIDNTKLFEVTPIHVDTLPQDLNWVALGLTPNTTYEVKTAYTTRGFSLILPSPTATGNGTFGDTFRFTTLP